MPTASKLLAALSLAALGWIASEMIKPLVPFSTQWGWFNQVNAIVGFVVGWMFLGSRAGGGLTSAINNGVTSAFAMAVIGVLVQATNEMVRLSFARRYDSPFEAVTAIFEISIDYAEILLDVPLLLTLLIGGVIAAILVEVVGKYWR
ncbi:TrgA family protein [Maliponia aquimaris]|uniref:Tellurium resistance protein n=1 Tax=Maliponia aquimaris TaxID=1673631 RepID=A0A238L0P5_9RHOB|nr:TrgA family protein [Maliponia aquimaris]SMX48498.1 hypothetical protein MAA8898_03963 [Maliponia aquimaris]